ncbi:hypothetical protein PSA7680_00644 [Pseudoruegeria aquimaris]|uniref:DUF6456 domain-containing protein n=1 Tax=Pseudoruegeria aquimaris TaxID=393663 RepID=A0A1Y5RK84_9RHOB|nr:hypothetical protein PSA7680_00644 [Pseudoruegeria aquimaris]
MKEGVSAHAGEGFPDWVPMEAQLYLFHTESGRSIRSLARGAGCHASTVLRQIRKYEARREDPLVDRALLRLGRRHLTSQQSHPPKETYTMTHVDKENIERQDDAHFRAEAQRVLARLLPEGSFLAVAAQMENAVVMRPDEAGEPCRVAVVHRDVAEGLALKEWIAASGEGRVRRYRITAQGRSWLKARRGETARAGLEEGPAGFDFPASGGPGRPVVAESPLAILARRKDRNGRPFLTPELVAAGEQLREDFELAQVGERTCQNWDHFLTGAAQPTGGVSDLAAAGPAAARARVMSALRELGPGLGDVVLRSRRHGARRAPHGMVCALGQDRAAHRAATPAPPLRRDGRPPWSADRLSHPHPLLLHDAPTKKPRRIGGA